MIPLCRICNHEHGVADPHVFATIAAIHTPDKGTVYVPSSEHVPGSEKNTRAKKKDDVVKFRTPRLHKKKSAAGSEDAAARLARVRSQRAASMRRYRAKLKTRVAKD